MTRILVLMVLCLGVLQGFTSASASGSRGMHRAGGERLLDEITLIDGTVISGSIVKKIANNIVIRRESGTEEVLPAGLVKSIRRANEVESISLSEYLGEAKKPGSGGSSTSSSAGTPEKKDSTSGKASVLVIDRAVAGDKDSFELLKEAWDSITPGTRQVIIVIEDVVLSAEVALWLHREMADPAVDFERSLVIGRTDSSALALFSGADRVFWKRGGEIQTAQLPDRLRGGYLDLGVPGMTESVVQAFCNGGDIQLNELGRLTPATTGESFSSLTAKMALDVGCGDGIIETVDREGVVAILPSDRAWKLNWIRLKTLLDRAKRQKQEDTRRVAKCQEIQREIGSAVSKVRSTASAFESLYKKYSIRSVWNRDRSWKNPDDEKRSVEAQTKVRDALLMLKNRIKTLSVACRGISDDHPLRAGFDRCVDAGQAALKTLLQYERAIMRNQTEPYETYRGRATGLSIGGC